jgi:HD-like signal output (HDOD) protein/CheY-like chemotaxis protein
MKKVLFVDDEPRVLQGLGRMLHSVRGEWEIALAESGAQALDLMAQSAFDVVVSDMRMPGMDGAELLNEVKERYPQAVRIILSGHSDERSIARCIGKAHQYMAKPCDADGLVSAISRACALRELLGNPMLKRFVSRMENLPSMPSLYLELKELLSSGEPSVQQVAAIISGDVGMVAKILQLVNSAFFGFYQHITSPERAVSVLGLQTISSLVLSSSVFSQYGETSVEGFSVEAVTRHSLSVGMNARTIMRTENQPPLLADETLTGGLLHDVGKIVLAANLPSAYEEVVKYAREFRVPEWQAELEIVSATHADIGAYLLGLWGLPDSVVEAAAFHHCPRECSHQSLSPLTAVHVSNALDHMECPDDPLGRVNDPLGRVNDADALVPPARIDDDYIGSLGLESRLAVWADACGGDEERGACA